MVSGAALLGTLEIVEKQIDQIRGGLGAGAAGLACAEHYLRLRVQREDSVMVDTIFVPVISRTANHGPTDRNCTQPKSEVAVASWRDFPKCKNCGHDRMDHNYDDACWHEVRFDGGGGLCQCSGYEPEKAAQESARMKITRPRSVIVGSTMAYAQNKKLKERLDLASGHERRQKRE